MGRFSGKRKDYLDHINACQDLALLVINIVVNWKRKILIKIQVGELFHGVQCLFRAQKIYRMEIFLDGCIAYQWASIQKMYYKWRG